MIKQEKLHALEILLTIGCRLDCLYCPQRLLLNKYFSENENRKNKLSFEDFKVVLDKVQAGATISFCGMSEPFHNERCADMIVYAYERGYKVCLLTTLVGMTMEDFEKIKDVKFDSFVLHIPDAEGHSKFDINENYLKLLEAVNEKIDIDYYSCHGTVSPAVKDFIDRDKYAGIALGDRAGNLEIENYPHEDKKGKIICYHGSEAQVGGWSPVMLPDGTLVLCCHDYGMKHSLGNLITQSWSEIQEGVEFQKFRNGLNDDTIDILCRKCSDAKEVETLPAMQLRKAIIDYKKNNWDNKDTEIYEFVKKFAEADNVCVFGLGKLFNDHYYQEYWNEGLQVNLFSDNNEQKYNIVINGIKCVDPIELANYENLLVIIFAKNGGESIRRQLKENGVHNTMLIDDVFNMCNKLCKIQFKKMSI